ncbi:hypothetical protein N7520_005244 [Penicillium odoratum]|uniref:uncharacterized protein n=1 Tax=Penicillium odoratum TaxID=1167516 RepID=UPI0025477DDC|nr:uncharacterized protein N7520_005244 [Penicillium odoratum]KAJ5765685.1 hypothetical protein N7520_005244 [Penicillium odoratum]
MEYPPNLSPQSPRPNGLFRPRRSEDWHEYRETIEQLYRSDQLKLRDVKRIMERDHKFYKDRLAAWNVRKNIKAAEVQVMIRKKQKRAARGKQTAFRRAGQDVDPKRLTRFVRRYGTQWVKNRDKDDELNSPEPKTPSDMSCYTPEPEEGAATPISPTDVQSPRETPPYSMNYDPNNLATMPDLHQHQHQHSHSTPRRPYHPSELSRPSHPSVHSMLHSPVHLNPIHIHPPGTEVTIPPIQIPSQMQIQPGSGPGPASASTSASAPTSGPALSVSVPGPVSSIPASTSVPSVPVPVSAPAPAPAPVPSHSNSHPHHQFRDDIDAADLVSNFGGWTRLDLFQNRLESLQQELDRSMSKWRDQEPGHEINGHHEGLGQ